MQRINANRIYLTLIIALVFQILPWSGFGLYIHPDFVLLVLLYWILRAPKLCSIGTAWLSGLVIDLATGSLFGQNALAYALTAFFAVTYQRRLILFTVWQQTAYVFLLLIVNQICLLVLKLFAGGENPGWLYFLPCISGILLWYVVAFSSVGSHGKSKNN